MLWIRDHRNLLRCVQSLAESDAVALDTEFVREGSYEGRLALIQVASRGGLLAVIDPFEAAPLDPLFEVLADSGCQKVLHSGQQDVALLCRRMGSVPGPVFDTQIAAGFLGYGERVSLSDLLEAELGVTLTKDQAYTNWLRRPLTPQQLEYAASDVEYLISLSDRLKQRLAREGRAAWAEDVLRERYAPEAFQEDPSQLYRRIRHAAQLTCRELAVLRELAAWREEEAQRADRPRRSVATDQCLLQLARLQVTRPADLAGMRGLGKRYQREGAYQVVAAIRRGQQVPESRLPEPVGAAPGDPEVQSAVDVLLAFVKARGRRIGVAPAYLTNPAELQQLVEATQKGSTPEGLGVLQSWRFQCVGQDLRGLLSGNVALGLSGGSVALLERRAFGEDSGEGPLQ